MPALVGPSLIRDPQGLGWVHERLEKLSKEHAWIQRMQEGRKKYVWADMFCPAKSEEKIQKSFQERSILGAGEAADPAVRRAV